MGIPGQIGLSLPYVVDLINPERRSVTWNFYDASARYVALLIFNIIRPIPQRIMVAVSFTNVLPVRPIAYRSSESIYLGVRLWQEGSKTLYKGDEDIGKDRETDS